MIHLKLPTLPPSTNTAYITVARKRILTKEGRAYKAQTTAYIVKNFPTVLTIFKPDTAYGYIVQLSFPNLLNKGWPNEAQTRYKRLDATNRSKLLEDAMAEAFGIDDSVFLSTRFDKIQGEEQTHIWVWNMEEECPYAGHPLPPS